MTPAQTDPDGPEPEVEIEAETEIESEAAGGTAPLAPLDLVFDAATVERLVEALLFASAEPMTAREILGRLPEGAQEGDLVQAALAALEARYADRGVRLMRAGSAYAFRTAADLAPMLSTARVEERPMSRAGIETLAIIAYHQPATRTEIEEIRGVGVSKGTLDFLLELGWVKLGPRRETPGRPATFVTTTAFLDHFGLSSARDLPGLKELRAAGLLDPAPQEGAAGDLLTAEEDGDDAAADDDITGDEALEDDAADGGETGDTATGGTEGTAETRTPD